VDVANFFHGETGIFGLFTEVGAPTRNYHAMLAFSKMLDTPRRLGCAGAVPGQVAVLAGVDAAKTKASVLIANLTGPAELRLSFQNLAKIDISEIRIVDATHALETIPVPEVQDFTLTLKFAPPVVALVTFSLK
jgi:hypothetical protein